MLVDLPGEKEREQILRLHLRDEKLDGDVNLGDIVRNTPYYSGSDLKNLCVSAAMASVKEAVGDFSWTPKTAPESNADTLSKIRTRTITLAHFTHAINEVHPSSSASSYWELRRWHDQFGRNKTFDDSHHHD